MNNPNEANNLLTMYLKDVPNPSQIERQFIILCETLSNYSLYSPEERLTNFEKAIVLTCPQYVKCKFPRILSFEEIIILNNIAVCYTQVGDAEQAILILYHLKRYYESNVMNFEEILRTQPLILYNLSKYLGCSGRYDECIEIADLGIRIARETGRCSFLDGLLYNRAWSLMRRKRDGDKETALSSAKQAFELASIMENGAAVNLYKNFLKTNFPEINY